MQMCKLKHENCLFFKAASFAHVHIFIFAHYFLRCIKRFATLKVSIITGPKYETVMKNFRNNSWAFLLVVSFLIGVSFVDHSRPGYLDLDYSGVTDTTKQPRMV